MNERAVREKETRNEATDKRSRLPLSRDPLLDFAEAVGNRGMLAFTRASASADPSDRPRERPALSSGSPIDPVTRSAFEPVFGADLSTVRVHDDGAAQVAARAAHAHAFTLRDDIAFAAGRYAPETTEGRRLMAHELTHVVQQRSTAFPEAPARMSEPTDPQEREADLVADAIARGAIPPPITAHAGAAVARQDTDLEPALDEDEEPADRNAPDADDDFAAVQQPFTSSVSEDDPSVVFVPIAATREAIARGLSTDVAAFYPVDATEAKPPAEDQHGIRFYAPSTIPADLMTQLRTKFEARIGVDVDATVSALVSRSGGWSAAQYALRWSQYSAYTDTAERSYFDRFLDALSARTITTTKDRFFWTSKSSQSALDELLSVTSGDINAAVRRARARSSQGAPEDATLSASIAELPPGHVVGRWISGQDTAGVAAQVVDSFGGWRVREEAEIRTRNAPFLGSKVMILGADGNWHGYGIMFDTSAAGTLFPPVVGGPEEKGRFYWYYPSTVYFGAGEFNTIAPSDQPFTTGVERSVLDDALGSTDNRALLALDTATLSHATVEERIAIVQRIVDSGLSHTERLGYTSSEAAEALARTVIAMTPEDFLVFERKLDEAGLTARILATKDARFAPLGAAFTFQTLAATQLGPNAFAEPTMLSQGSEDSASLDYFIANPTKAKSHVVARGEWNPTATPGASVGGGVVEPGLEGEQTGDVDRTLVSFEYGTSPMGWGDTPAWDRRSRQNTRAFLPTELLTIESVTHSGRHRRIASAFEAALTQGDPKSDVESESFQDFLNVVLLVTGGLGIARLGAAGLRAFAAGNLRSALTILGEELASEAGKRAVRSVVDLVLFNAARYAHEHQEELEKTPEGRAFMAAVTVATVVLAARDIGHLVESGAIERVLATGRGALTFLSDAAKLGVRRTMQNFRAARIAWEALSEEGLLVETNVGGFRMRVPRSAGDMAVAFRTGQAQAAGEELMTTLGAGSPQAARAQSVLGKLERGAGGFKRPAGRPPTEAEEEAARSYRDVARHAAGLPEAQRQAFLDAADRVLGAKGRSIAELAPFVRGAVRAASRGGDAVAYLDAVEWLAGSGISREGFARLAANAVGRNAVDLVWLKGTSLTPEDLDFLARDPHIPWADFVKASRDPADLANRTALLRSMRATRGAGAEIVAGEEASNLVPGYRVSRRQVPMGDSEIDYELVSTDRLARRRGMEVKGWTKGNWKKSFNAYEREAAGEVLTDPMDKAGAGQIKKMVKQLEDASAAATRGEKPVLAVTNDMRAEDVTKLRELLRDKGLNVDIVLLPEGKITAASKRLGTAIGIR